MTIIIGAIALVFLLLTLLAFGAMLSLLVSVLVPASRPKRRAYHWESAHKLGRPRRAKADVQSYFLRTRTPEAVVNNRPRSSSNRAVGASRKARELLRWMR